MFEVTFLGEDDSELTWIVEAETPETALKECSAKANRQHGTYSVWDPEDPHGMPLLERTIP